jgi:hypothetical protein
MRETIVLRLALALLPLRALTRATQVNDLGDSVSLISNHVLLGPLRAIGILN